MAFQVPGSSEVMEHLRNEMILDSWGEFFYKSFYPVRIGKGQLFRF
jgi:hypothetical protein